MASTWREKSVSSRGHWFSSVDFDDPNFEHRAYDPWLAYGQSKTANIHFAVEFDRRGQQENVGVEINDRSLNAGGRRPHRRDSFRRLAEHLGPKPKKNQHIELDL